ncbi:hypothetical protein OG455_39125 [Kitasatospora sp. NBC_01287]|uniref:hypothetical protein n=1 Tax=Kitasatospora sp. NBC_01287 TaxID=2903573 RepID=UPI00225C1570|nr:hypothetical protein [Kitasatospora sp. NBC_01287]MCX4751449.1 hypothetical protein [Kitasatospora sp. NBC_01287]
MSEQHETPTPAEAIPGGVVNPATPPATPAPEAPAPEAPAPEAPAPEVGEESAVPKPAKPDYRALYEKMQADLTATRERSNEAGVEADELRAQVAQLQEQALRDRIAAEYALPPVLAALVQGGDEAAIRQHAEALATVAAPKPLLGAGGLTPHAEPDPYKGLAEKLRQRRFGI